MNPLCTIGFYYNRCQTSSFINRCWGILAHSAFGKRDVHFTAQVMIVNIRLLILFYTHVIDLFSIGRKAGLIIVTFPASDVCSFLQNNLIELVAFQLEQPEIGIGHLRAE